jgi:hypothetical protein
MVEFDYMMNLDISIDYLKKYYIDAKDFVVGNVVETMDVGNDKMDLNFVNKNLIRAAYYYSKDD